MDQGPTTVLPKASLKSNKSSNFDPNLALNSLESLINEIKSTYVNTIEEKDKIILELQKENLGLKSLVNMMES